MKNANFQCVCSDLKVKETPLDGLCHSWLIRDYDGLKVGFFSLMPEDFYLITTAQDVKLARNNLNTARWAVRELRSHGADIIVALTHVGFHKDVEIAKAVRGSV